MRKAFRKKKNPGLLRDFALFLVWKLFWMRYLESRGFSHGFPMPFQIFSDTNCFHTSIKITKCRRKSSKSDSFCQLAHKFYIPGGAGGDARIFVSYPLIKQTLPTTVSKNCFLKKFGDRRWFEIPKCEQDGI